MMLLWLLSCFHYSLPLESRCTDDCSLGVEPALFFFFFSHSEQVCCVEFDRKDINMNKLVATSLEGKFHVFDTRTQHPTKGFTSVSEKVIAEGGAGNFWEGGEHFKKKKKIYRLLFLLLLSLQLERRTCRFEPFHSWMRFFGGLCLSNFLCGFLSRAKVDTGLVKSGGLLVGKCGGGEINSAYSTS